MSSKESALILVTSELVAQPDTIALLKEKFAIYDVHQQLLERLDEHAVELPKNKFSIIHLAGGALNGTVADILYDALKSGGQLTGHIGPDSKSSLIISGFIANGDHWSKANATTSTLTALPISRKNGSDTKEKRKNLTTFRRAPVQEESEYIDEDDLVMDANVKSAFNFPAKCDPGPGKKRRRACKDCTCGLKEAEEAENALAERNQNTVMLNHDEIAEIDFTVPGKAVGGCGSCALGDAFRCDGCPYLGLPPFKPGEVVSVDQFGDDF